MATSRYIQVSLFVLTGVCTVYASIQFGALLDSADDVNEDKAFELAKRSVLREGYLANIQLRSQVVSDVFSLSSKLCSLASEGRGVAAIFGPYAPVAADYVKSFISALKIPHIQYNPEFDDEQSESDRTNPSLSLNFWPDIREMRVAYRDLIEIFRWKKYLVLTSKGRQTGNIAMLTDILKFDSNEGEDVIVSPVTSNSQAIEQLQIFYKYKNIIVDLPEADLADFIQQSYDNNLMSGYYHFHFVSLDISTLTAKIGNLTKGAVNVTSFSLIDFDSTAFKDMSATWRDIYRYTDMTIMRKTKNALIFDSVVYVSKIMARLLSHNPNLKSNSIVCDGSQELIPWRFGETLYRKLTSNSSRREQLLTGRIKIDADGIRRNFTLQLLEFDVDGKVSKVGRWNRKDRMVFTKTFDKVKEDVSKDFQKVEFKIAVKEEEPFVMVREFYDEEKTRPIPKDKPNDRFYGFNIDMMKEIAIKLDMRRYKFIEVNSSSTEINGTWTGIVGGLMNTEYDIGLSPITVTVARSEVVDFTRGYLDLGISILFLKPEEEKIGLWSFMAPFKGTLWLAILGAFLTTSFVLHMVGRFSPGQWDNPHPCSPEVDILENDLNPSNSLWFAMGSFLQQGTEIMPKSGPTRIIATFWWLFCLICVSSYTANLAAFLTKSKMKLQINDAADLASQQKIKYGCYDGGATRDFFKKSSISTYSKMNVFMAENNEKYNVKSAEQAVEWIKNGTYAYIMESVTLRYKVATDPECKLIEIGSELNSLMYSIALPKGSPYTRDLSRVVLQLKEEQVILNLYNKWWKVNENQCKDANKPVSQIESSKLDLDNFQGVFLVLGVLIIFGFVVLVVEFIFGAYKASKENVTSFGEELKQNFLFSLNCCKNDEKPIRWFPPQSEETEREYGDDLYGSFGRLSLSIGSLNTSTIPAWSEAPVSRSRTPTQYPTTSSRSRRSRRGYDSLPQRSRSNESMEMRDDLNITRDTEITSSSSEHSLPPVPHELTLGISSL